MTSTEKIEATTIRLVASNGKPIRKVTRITIDGHNIDFTEKLTAAQIAKYIASRQARQSAEESRKQTAEYWEGANR